MLALLCVQHDLPERSEAGTRTAAQAARPLAPDRESWLKPVENDGFSVFTFFKIEFRVVIVLAW